MKKRATCPIPDEISLKVSCLHPNHLTHDVSTQQGFVNCGLDFYVQRYQTCNYGKQGQALKRIYAYFTQNEPNFTIAFLQMVACHELVQQYPFWQHKNLDFATLWTKYLPKYLRDTSGMRLDIERENRKAAYASQQQRKEELGPTLPVRTRPLVKWLALAPPEERRALVAELKLNQQWDGADDDDGTNYLDHL